jgi:hypothetical protein
VQQNWTARRVSDLSFAFNLVVAKESLVAGGQSLPTSSPKGRGLSRLPCSPRSCTNTFPPPQHSSNPYHSSLRHLQNTAHREIVDLQPLIPRSSFPLHKQPGKQTSSQHWRASIRQPCHRTVDLFLRKHLLTRHSRTPHLTYIMFYSTAVIAAAAFSGLVAAQSTNETGTGPTIDANSVQYSLRQTWCRSQTQTCPQLCEDSRFQTNTCDPVSIQSSLKLTGSACANNSLRTPSPTLASALPT